MQIETQRKQGQQHLPETKQILQKSIKKNKEGHYIVTKGSIQEEDITLANIYAPEYIKQIPTDVKGETDNTTIIVRL